ncbi:MAG TPA: matrixin family metalloprotease [Actinomycetota bacterium]|nr:matrixin family metalloprotease [Actinomycetota bacterium]
MSQVPPPERRDSVPSPQPAERRSGSALFVVFVVTCVLAGALGALAVSSLLEEPRQLAAPPPGPTAAPSATASPSETPSPTPSPRPKVDGAFRFLGRIAGAPVRWNPCQTITYAVNTGGASPPVIPDLRAALRRVTDATGIPFRPVGRTGESFFRAYERMRFRGVARSELLVIWVDHERYERILRQVGDRRPSIAFAKTMAGISSDRDQYFGGIIVIDEDATATRGFNYRYTHGSVLLHELGHIMGLDHVRDPDQLMYSGRHPDFSLRDYGPGDLEGLRRLGTDAGCLD